MNGLIDSASKLHVTDLSLSPFPASTSTEPMKPTFKNLVGEVFHVDIDGDTSVTEAIRRFVEVWANKLQLEDFYRNNEKLRQVTQSVIDLAKSATPPVDINEQTTVGNALNRIDFQLDKDTKSELSVAMTSLKNELNESKAHTSVDFAINGKVYHARYITPNDDTRKLQQILQTEQVQTVNVIILTEAQAQAQAQEQANAELKARHIETTECSNDDSKSTSSEPPATQQQLASTNAKDSANVEEEEKRPTTQDKQQKECTIL